MGISSVFANSKSIRALLGHGTFQGLFPTGSRDRAIIFCQGEWFGGMGGAKCYHGLRGNRAGAAVFARSEETMEVRIREQAQSKEVNPKGLLIMITVTVRFLGL